MDGEKTVACENPHCGKVLKIKDAKGYGDVSKEEKMIYYCSTDCAISHIFSTFQGIRTLLEAMENGK